MLKEVWDFIKRKWVWLLSLGGIALVFNSWFLRFGIRTDGDWGFFLKETADTLRRHYFSIWLSDSSFGRVLIDAGQAPSYAIYGWLSHYFNVSYELSERLIHMWPAVLISIISSYILAKYIFRDRAAGVLGAIVYVSNTYYLTLLTGHLTLAVAYAFTPLIIFFYLKAITTRNKIFIILSALSLTICSAYEPRFAYIVTLVLAALAIFHFFLSFLREERVSLGAIVKAVGVYISPLIIFALLNLYWLLGLLMSGGSTGGGTAIESSLFGNEFFNISQALTLFHPFWSGGEVEPFILHELPLHLWLIPIAAFAGIMVSKKNYRLLFFGFLGLVGILLSKQSGEPFSSLYSWMFANFPGFNAYREASKFYMLIAISYSIMLPALYLHIKDRYSKKWLTVSVFGLLALLFLPNLAPIATNKIGSTFAERKMPSQYVELNNFLNQKDYYRTLWLPQKSRWSFVSANHPYVSGSKMLADGWKEYGESIAMLNNATSTDDMNELLKQPYMPELLSKGSIKYIVVPMRDSANDDDFYRSYNDDPAMFIETLSGQPYLKEVAQEFEGFKVYETKRNPQPYFSAVTDLYTLDGMKDLGAQYDAWKQISKNTDDFNFTTGSHDKKFTGDIRDLFGDIQSTLIADGAIKPAVLRTNKSSSFFFNKELSEISYLVRATRSGNEIVFKTQYLPSVVKGGADDNPKEKIVELAKGKDYLIQSGEEITLLNKRKEGVNLGSPKSDVSLYAVDSANLVPEPKIEKSLWQKEVNDCNNYGDKANIRLESLPEGERQVVSLFAKNHAACTGPGEITIAAENEYLLRFKYRTLGGQFASYRLTYNDPARTTITKDIPLIDELWRTYEKILTIPEGASSVNIQLIGRPSNQTAKDAHTLYDTLELLEVSKITSIARSDTLQKTEITAEQLGPYASASYTYPNLIKNGSFEEGLWQKEVNDCNNYDDAPALRMSLKKGGASDGKQALQLDAKRHIACTGPGSISVEGGKTYLLEFDYRSQNSKNAGYLVRFDGRKPSQISEQIPIKDGKWQTFRKTITIPVEASRINLSVFSYSDDEAPGKYFTNFYDNFSLKAIPDIKNAFYQFTSTDQSLGAPENITHQNVSNTLKKITVTSATKPFVLRMSEQYHAAWKLQYDNQQSNGAYNYMPWRIVATLKGTEHLKLNGFQNGWYINPTELCQTKENTCQKNADGTYTLALMVQFNGQRWFNFGLIISILTGVACIIALGYLLFRRPRSERGSGGKGGLGSTFGTFIQKINLGGKFMSKQTRSSKKPILLLGAYGRGNAGDDVFLHCALELFPDRPVYINSADDSLLPDVAKGRVQTISTVSPRDIFKKVRLYMQIKEVIYWGGDLWVELYGTRTPRQLLYKMVILNILLRLSGKRIYYVGCGIGKLSGFSLWLARLSARLAKRIIVREERTASVLNLPSVSLLPDLAINLPYHRPVLHNKPVGDRFRVVISVLQSIPNPDVQFPKLIADLADLIKRLPDDRFKISLLPMHMTEHEQYDDLWASKQLLALLPGRDIDIIYERDLEKTIDILRNCHLVIGGRLHANILALLNGTPALGISYRPKVKAFFADNSLGDYCLELAETNRLKESFKKIYDNYDAVSKYFYDSGKRNLTKRADYRKLAQEI